VVSRTLTNAGDGVTIGDNPEQLIHEIKASQGSEIILFGSRSVAQELIRINQVDDFWLFVNPVILGKGISFLETGTRIPLELVKTHSFNSGVVCLQYQKA